MSNNDHNSLLQSVKLPQPFMRVYMLGNIPIFPQEKKMQAGGITPGETTDIVL